MKFVLVPATIHTTSADYKVFRRYDNTEVSCKMTKEYEISLLAKISHPSIIKLEHWMEPISPLSNGTMNIMLTEKLNGINLYQYMMQNGGNMGISEYKVIEWIKQICHGLSHLHSHKIIHRDINPYNILLKSRDNSNEIRITNFGRAIDCSDGPIIDSILGSPYYISPEMLNGHGYDTKTDMWSLGVTLYTLLYGFPPFYEITPFFMLKDQKNLFRLIKECKYRFPVSSKYAVSQRAKDLIKALLEMDPVKRLNAEDVLKHEWIIRGPDDKAHIETDTTLKHKEMGSMNRRKESKLIRSGHGQRKKHRISKYELIVSGYVRNIEYGESFLYIIPKDIMGVLVEFYMKYSDYKYFKLSMQQFESMYSIQEQPNNIHTLTIQTTSGNSITTVIRNNDKKKFVSKKSNIHEISTLSKLSHGSHQSVIKLQHWYHDEKKNEIRAIIEYYDGSDLFEIIPMRFCKRQTSRIEEWKIIRWLKQICTGLQYLHDRNIIHRDIQPDSFILKSSADSDTNSNSKLKQAQEIRITEFGFAGDCSHCLMTKTMGNSCYLSPEMIDGKEYDTKTDMWSLGVTLYFWLYGFPPFYDMNKNVLRRLISECEYKFYDQYQRDPVNEDAKDLIRKLLVIDPKERLSANEVLQHHWINKAIDFDINEFLDEIDDRK